jgi:hypothetical protein
MTLPDNPNHIELLERFKSKFWLCRGWFVQCHLRDRGQFFRLSTVQSPIINILYWPDDEVLLGPTTTILYSNVTHIELWWNLSKSTQAICPNVRTIRLYGADDGSNEPFHPNVCDILQCPSLEHIIIDDNVPITQERLAAVLAKSSNNVQILTCSTHWLLVLLEDQQYEWICLLLTMRIRKLIVNDDEIVLFGRNVIAFCRTFIHLQEITIKMESTQDLFLLLNTLEQLTMANIELNVLLDDEIYITKWLQENTILVDFVVRKQITTRNTCKLILWIGSRRASNSSVTTNDLYLKHPIINRYIAKC